MKSLRGVMAPLLALVLLLAVAGCAQAPDWPGTYHAKTGETQVELILGEDGKGVWSTEDDDVPLTWEVKKGEVWMHTKSGGVLPGRVGGDGVLLVELPGVGKMTFRKVR